MALNHQIFVVNSIYGRFDFSVYLSLGLLLTLQKYRNVDVHWKRYEDEPLDLKNLTLRRQSIK